MNDQKEIKEVLTPDEWIYDVETTYLKTFQLDWFSQTFFYLMTIFLILISAYAWYFVWTNPSLQRLGLAYFAIYFAVAYGCMKTIIDGLTMFIRDITHRKYYNETKAEHEKRRIRIEEAQAKRQKTFVDEGGTVEPEV